MGSVDEGGYRATVVIGVGPMGAEARDLGWVTQEAIDRGITRVKDDGASFTTDVAEDAKRAITVEGETAEVVRWYFETVVKLRRDEPGWDEMDRQLARQEGS